MSIISDAETALVPGVGPAAVILKHLPAILMGVMTLGLVVAFFIQKAETRHWHKAFDNQTVALHNEIVAHQITLASVDTLQASLASQNAAVAAMAKAGTDAQTAAKSALTASQRANAGALATADNLDRLAGMTTGKCKTPSGISSAGL